MKSFFRLFSPVITGTLLSLSLLCSSRLCAQTADTVGLLRVDSLRTLVVLRDTVPRLFIGYYMLTGGQSVSTQNLTDFLARSGVGESLLTNEIFGGKISAGFGVSLSTRRLRFMGEFMVPVPEINTISAGGTRVREVSFSTSEWQLRCGINAVFTGGLEIFPLFGFGSRTSHLQISEKESNAFSDIFNDSTAFSYAFDNTGFDLALGFGAQYNFYLGKEENEITDLSLGVRAEYAMGLTDTWHQAGRNDPLEGGPDMSGRGFNIWLTLGLRARMLQEFSVSILGDKK